MVEYIAEAKHIKNFQAILCIFTISPPYLPYKFIYAI